MFIYLLGQIFNITVESVKVLLQCWVNIMTYNESVDYDGLWMDSIWFPQDY